MDAAHSIASLGASDGLVTEGVARSILRACRVREGVVVEAPGRQAARPDVTPAPSPVRVLMVDDERADYDLIHPLFANMAGGAYDVQWAGNYEAALQVPNVDLYLVDYYLGARTGVDLLPDLRLRGANAPVILISGRSDRAVDIAAMRAGAADILVKGGLCEDVLERSIRYALTRHREETARAHLAAIVEASDDAILSLQMDGTVISWNPGAERMLGWSAEEAVGRHVSFLAPDDRKTEWQNLIEGVKHGERILHFQTTRLRKDGRPIHVSLSLSPLFDAAGHLVGVASVGRDITFSKQAEAAREQALQALRESEARFHAFMDNSPAAAYLKDEEGRYVYVNALARRWLSRDGAEVLGRSDQDLWPPESAARMRERDLDVLRTGHAVEYYETLVSADGQTQDWLILKFVIQSQGRRLVGGMSVDVTEQRSLEEQLRQSQKMEALGRLAGGVAHDFNNMLTVINGYCELLLVNPRLEQSASLALEEVKQAGERATSLTRQLLAFSRKQVVQPQVLDLNRVVSDIEKMLGRLIGEDIELAIVPGSNLGTVMADPGQVEQIIMNLAVNSRDAMPLGGCLTIETENATVVEEDAARLQIEPGPYAALVVSDNGFGMDREVLQHIFEPFFTTKPDGKGTGIGLATVYGIVRASGGAIEVQSEPGQGTTFRILLSRAVQPVRAVQQEERPALPGGTETILLVEDEPMVRRLARTVMQRLGYLVLEAAAPSEALEICSQHDGTIDLLVTDVVMPQMSGRVLAEALTELRPEMGILYMSGYTDDAVLHHGVQQATHAFLSKPFKPEVLARRLRQILDRDTGPA